MKDLLLCPGIIGPEKDDIYSNITDYISGTHEAIGATNKLINLKFDDLSEKLSSEMD